MLETCYCWRHGFPLTIFASPEKTGRRCIPWHQCVALHTGFLRVSHWSSPVTGRDSRVWGGIQHPGARGGQRVVKKAVLIVVAVLMTLAYATAASAFFAWAPYAMWGGPGCWSGASSSGYYWPSSASSSGFAYPSVSWSRGHFYGASSSSGYCYPVSSSSGGWYWPASFSSSGYYY